MAYFLSFSGLAILVILAFLLLQAARTKNNELLAHSEPFRAWYEAQDLSLYPFKVLIKKGLLAIVLLAWICGVILAGINEGVAYTLLVFLLGWAPAFALSVILMAVFLLFVQFARYVLFVIRWAFRLRGAIEVSVSSKSDSTY